jgi:hypothetical protein
MWNAYHLPHLMQGVAHHRHGGGEVEEGDEKVAKVCFVRWSSVAMRTATKNGSETGGTGTIS